MHKNHQIIEVLDEESLKNENITLENSTKNFDNLLSKIVSLKEKIEEEINKINNLFEKANEDLTKSFKIKHEKLNQEENEIREKLQNEVTKAKEKLEIFLSESNNEITLTERIKQGLKKLEKKENKNIYQKLSYISKMNKNDKAMNKLFWQIMNSINFYYKEEESNIIYEEYTFNGININKIKLSDISFNSLKISWDLEIDKIINKNDIEFILEMKQENKDENFRQIYKGKYSNFYFINDLIPNTNYEFRICLFYKENKGPWVQTKKVKTNDFDSEILHNCELKSDYIKILSDWTNCKKVELIYRGTRDGSQSEKFHELCDNQGPTIVLYKNEKGNIFGGYASISWQNSGELKSAPDSFIFTLTNIYNINPTKFESKKDGKEVYHHLRWGPRFGDGRDIGTEGDFLKKDSYTCFPYTYKDVLGKGKTIFTGDYNIKTEYFKIKEIEVFKCD